MAGPLELRGVDSRSPREPVEREGPGKRMRPFIAKHRDGLGLLQFAVAQNHESLSSPKALAQDGFGEPGRQNDEGEG